MGPRHVALTLALVAGAAGPALANPRVLRGGANHHLGDDSFVATYGHAPVAGADGGDGNDESTRMHAHLVYARQWLAGRSATSPALADRRALLLGYLDEYIAHGETPHNTYVAARNPVFIDAAGRICAVGYLIERTAGRALAERIAREHRLDYLEDIADAVPEVASWVARSGFTLDELASIQPGYEGPEVMHTAGWVTPEAATRGTWAVGAPRPGDGPYHVVTGNVAVDGAFARGQMTGLWTVSIDGEVRGRGTFDRGAATWTSYRPDGTRLAEGPFRRSRAHGAWTFFHGSGRVAARGSMTAGARDGRWTFFHDDDTHRILSVGRFAAGETLGPWRHYTSDGQLVATARGRAWSSLELDVEPVAGGIRHDLAQGIPAESTRVDTWYRGAYRLYVDHLGRMFDEQGRSLEHTEIGWIARACRWSARERKAMRTGDVRALLGVVGREDLACTGPAHAVVRKEGARLDALLAATTAVGPAIPAFDLAPGAPAKNDSELRAESDSVDDMPVDAEPASAPPADFASYLANTMTWYIEWPHVDGAFTAVYATLPGYATP